MLLWRCCRLTRRLLCASEIALEGPRVQGEARNLARISSASRRTRLKVASAVQTFYCRDTRRIRNIRVLACHAAKAPATDQRQRSQSLSHRNLALRVNRKVFLTSAAPKRTESSTSHVDFRGDSSNCKTNWPESLLSCRISC